MSRDSFGTGPRDLPGSGWTIIGPTDRAMDLHLQLLVDEATDALSRIKDTEQVKTAISRATHGRGARFRI